MTDSEGAPYVPGVPMQSYLDDARGYDVLQLDVAIAQMRAMASVYVAHGYPVTARVCGAYWLGLVEIRRELRQLREAVDDALYPCVDDPNPDEFVGQPHMER